MHTAGALREGAPLVVAGRTIGKIEAIALSPRGASKLLGGDEGVAITVAVDAAALAKVGRGGDVFVASRGPLSESYLELGAAPEGAANPFRDGDEVLGRDPPSLDRVLQRTFDNLTLTATFADALRPELTALRSRVDTLLGDLRNITPPGPLRDQVDAALAEGRRTYDVGLGGDTGADRLRALVEHARATVAELRPMLDALQAKLDALRAGIQAARGRVDARLPPLLDTIQLAIDRGEAAIAKIDPMLAVVDDLADRIARGEGTIGKLATDPEFPEDAKELGKLLKRNPWRIIGHPDDSH